MRTKNWLRRRLVRLSGALLANRRAAQSKTWKGNAYLILLVMVAALSLSGAAQILQGAEPDSADPAEIVWRMVARNETRDREMRYFAAPRRRPTAALTPFNYNFIYNQETSEAGRRLYVFSVEPKRKDNLLNRERIWIDAEDYSVVRTEVQPFRSASFRIK